MSNDRKNLDNATQKKSTEKRGARKPTPTQQRPPRPSGSKPTNKPSK